ncbi:TorF family putative porin [Duganella sp. PWIR1]
MFHRHIAVATAVATTVAATLACTPAAFAADAADAPSWTGHVDLVSRYVLRGITETYGPGTPLGNAGADAPESDRAALQWGADWSHPSGFYAGYFGSMVNYSYQRLGESYSNRDIMDFQRKKSVENDLYGGYNGKAGEFTYTIGATGYVYLNGKHSDALETKLAVGYGQFTLGAQTLLNDVIWGNQGDTYWTLNFAQPLPYAMTLSASLGYYTYQKQGKFLGSRDTALGVACAAGQSFFDNGCLPGGAPSSGGFRHLIIGVSQPIGETGVTWNLQGILGGDNRFGVRQKNQVLAAISYGF